MYLTSKQVVPCHPVPPVAIVLPRRCAACRHLHAACCPAAHCRRCAACRRRCAARPPLSCRPSLCCPLMSLSCPSSCHPSPSLCCIVVQPVAVIVSPVVVPHVAASSRSADPCRRCVARGHRRATRCRSVPCFCRDARHRHRAAYDSVTSKEIEIWLVPDQGEWRQVCKNGILKRKVKKKY